MAYIKTKPATPTIPLLGIADVSSQSQAAERNGAIIFAKGQDLESVVCILLTCWLAAPGHLRSKNKPRPSRHRLGLMVMKVILFY